MEKPRMVNLSVRITDYNYKNLKLLSSELETPMSRIINAVLNGYFKAKRERERRDNAL